MSSSAPRLTQEQRSHIFSQLPPDTKALALASARVYHAPFSGRQDSWQYSGLEGMLVFGRTRLVIRVDKPLGIGPGTSFEYQYWLRLVNMNPGKGVTWMYQVPADLQYRLDKPFFHTFTGKTRMFGLRFDEDADADRFYKKVASHLHINAPPRKIKKTASQTQATNAPLKENSTRVKPSLISGPAAGSFVHVSHVGFKNGRIEASADVEPGWTMMLEELQGHGVALERLRSHGITDQMIAKNRDFVDGFVKGAKAAATKENSRTNVDDKKRKPPHRKPVTFV